jgi:hypothetical protein
LCLKSSILVLKCSCVLTVLKAISSVLFLIRKILVVVLNMSFAKQDVTLKAF